MQTATVKASVETYGSQKNLTSGPVSSLGVGRE